MSYSTRLRHRSDQKRESFQDFSGKTCLCFSENASTDWKTGLDSQPASDFLVGHALPGMRRYADRIGGNYANPLDGVLLGIRQQSIAPIWLLVCLQLGVDLLDRSCLRVGFVFQQLLRDRVGRACTRNGLAQSNHA